MAVQSTDRNRTNAAAQAARTQAAATKAADKVHTVQKGDTLSKIARDNNTNWQDLAKHNNLKNPDMIHPGQQIRIPGQAQPAQAAAEAKAAEAAKQQPATVTTAPTGYSQAAPAEGNQYAGPATAPKPSVSQPSLRSRAAFSPASPAAPAAPPAAQPGAGSAVGPAADKVHTVQSGDTLSKIAGQNNTTWQNLAQANNISNPNVIHAGQQIRIPGAGPSTPANAPAGAPEAAPAAAPAQGPAAAAPATPGAPGQLSPVDRVIDTTARHESGGSYKAWNPNDNGAGVAYGLIQFNQKKGSLPSLMQTMHQKDPAKFNETFGANAQNMLDSNFVRNANLNDPTLKAQMQAAGDVPAFQQAQRDLARSGYFEPAKAELAKHGLTSERAHAMAFDTAVQFGVGGMKDKLGRAVAGGGTEQQKLERFADIVDNSSRWSGNRRHNILNSSQLSDGPMGSGPAAPASGPASTGPAPAAEATAPASSAPAATSVLRRGAKGPEVQDLQRKLNEAGFSAGPVDGDYGPKTEAAVRDYQRSRGLTVDGIAGPQTHGALGSGAAATQPSSPAASTSPINNDGQWGPTTKASDFVKAALAQDGDRYVFGHEVSMNDKNPDTFDCSELVQWASAQAGVTFNDGARFQYAASKQAGLDMSVQDAIKTPGALLFREGTRDGKRMITHVAISLGNGKTIEARGRKWGVGSWDANNYTHAGLIPGMDYSG